MSQLERIRNLLAEARHIETLSLVDDVVGLDYVVGHEPHRWHHGGEGLQDRGWGDGWGSGCGDGGPDDFLDGHGCGDYQRGDGGVSGFGEGAGYGWGKSWCSGSYVYGVGSGARCYGWETWNPWWRR